MSDLKNNALSFNLPTYIHTPFFLYQDNRLERAALIIASFFYSLHTSGLKITASKDYLCALAKIGKTQYFSTLNQLESLGYIQRSGFTNRKNIKWSYCPKSEIIVDESNTSPDSRTNVENLNTSSGARTKLVREPELILSGLPDTNTKVDTKVNKKLTTEDQPQSSSSFFSKKQTSELLGLKLSADNRSDELFLEHCQYHIENQTNENSKFQRIAGIKKILSKLRETGEHFKAKGFIDIAAEELKAKKEEQRLRAQQEAQEHQHQEYLANLKKMPEKIERVGNTRRFRDVLKGIDYAHNGTMQK